jgi:hypothetical protein
VESWDAFRATDPDLARWRMGARAVLTAGAAALALTALARGAHEPITIAFVGVIVGMMGAVVVDDPDPRAQRRTTLLLPVPAVAALALGTLLAPSVVAGSLVFLAVIFAAVAVRRFGPRGTALGMIAFFAYFDALFFHARLADVPWMAVGVAIAVGIAYVVRFGLVRDVPERILRRSMDTFRRIVALALARMARFAADPRPRNLRRARRALRLLNDTALTVEDHLADPPPGLDAAALRARVFAAEAAVHRVATRVRRGEDPPEAAVPLLRAAAGGVRDVESLPEGGPDPPLAVAGLPEGGPDPPLAVAGLPHDGPAALRHALDELLRALRGGPAAARGDDPLPDLAPPPDHSLRLAVQATVAAGLALVAGRLLSTQRWYWAVIGAFVMFTRATTLGDTLARGWQRLAGTALGVLAGVGLAEVVAGHRRLELAALFGCLFLAYYLFRLSYAALVFAITVVLAVLYSLLGRFTPGLLLLRLEETFLGCAIGGLVAALVLPASTTERVDAALAAALRELADLLDAPDPYRVQRVRRLDRRVRDLRDAARPLTGGVPGLTSARRRRQVHLVGAAVLFARHVAAPAPDVAADARALAHALEARLPPDLRAAPPADEWAARVEGALRELARL